MKAILIALILAIATSAGAAKSKKIDWSLCERELKEPTCAKITDDHKKHECIEKLPKENVSEDCRVKNEKLEGQFKHKH